MPQLTLIRTKEWINGFSEVTLYLNDEKIGILKNGETKHFDVPAGTHQLEAKLEKFSSNLLPFELKEGETKTLVLHNYKCANWGIIALTILFVVSIFTPISALWFIPLTLLVGLRPIYFATKGKKNYFRLIPIP